MPRKISVTAQRQLKELGHPQKLKILMYLHEKGPTYVKEIYKNVEMEQAKCSIFLGHMRKAKLVKFRADGRKVFYSVNYEELNNQIEDLKDFFSSGTSKEVTGSSSASEE